MRYSFSYHVFVSLRWLTFTKISIYYLSLTYKWTRSRRNVQTRHFHQPCHLSHSHLKIKVLLQVILALCIPLGIYLTPFVAMPIYATNPAYLYLFQFVIMLYAIIAFIMVHPIFKNNHVN